jgi:hypothetical protein
VRDVAEDALKRVSIRDQASKLLFLARRAEPPSAGYDQRFEHRYQVYNFGATRGRAFPTESKPAAASAEAFGSHGGET